MPTANPSGTKWFSKLLPIRAKNKGLSDKQKKANAENDCRKLLALRSQKLEVKKFIWTPPTKKEKRHKLTVFIGLKKGRVGGPGDPAVKSPSTPPPSM